MLVIAAVSVLSVIGSAVMLPRFLLRLPPDYFVAHPLTSANRRPLRNLLRNMAGFLLVSLGVALLILPGQGVLTMLAGLMVCEFDNKKKLLLKTIQTLKLGAKLNHYREKHQRLPFLGL